MQGFRGPKHGFGGYAADVDAGAANGAVADQSDMGALLGGRDGDEKSGRSGINDRQTVATIFQDLRAASS